MPRLALLRLLFSRLPLSPFSPPPHLSVFLLSVVLACTLAPLARAMSVIPPTFEELVAESDTVVRGTVTAVRAEEFDSPQGRGVRTLVTFRIERTLKSTASAAASTADTLTLSFLGGTVGPRTLRVVGMPTFTVGQRQLVFAARNGAVMCPLIGAGHGRYHVVTDAATQREYLTRENRVPLTSTDEIALPLAAGATADLLTRRVSAAQALTLAAFETCILDTVARTAPTAQVP
jgi:hypothetical protein